jgi:exosortase
VPHNVRGYLLPGAVCVAAFLGAYGSVIWRLLHDWATDGNYTHGFLLAPVAGYLIWRKRNRLRAMQARPSAIGLAVVLVALVTLVVGSVAADLFLMRSSLVLLVAGAVAFFWGWNHLRELAFPIGLALLTIPIPTIIFNQISFPLQLLASRVGVALLQFTGVPALREGNVILLSNTQLEVAEACSGLRSLVSLFSLGLLYAYFSHPQSWVRGIIALITIPIAILTNALRVAGTGVAAHFYGAAAATGFLHTFSGWLMFVVSMVLFMAVGAALGRLATGREPYLEARVS